MNIRRICGAVVLVALSINSISVAQTAGEKKSDATPKAGVLTSVERQKLIPQNFFYAGQTAPVQMRNASAFRLPSGKLVLAAMVDTSGYSSAIAEKYQGFLIAETKVRIGDKELPAGAYGFGALADGRFIVTDLGANEVFSVPFATDENLKRPVPLKFIPEGQSVRLYLGKRYVGIEAL